MPAEVAQKIVLNRKLEYLQGKKIFDTRYLKIVLPKKNRNQ